MASSKTVSRFNPAKNAFDKLATFELTGDDTCAAIWHDAGFEFEMEQQGLLVGGKRLTPADGRSFYEALDHAFGSSSLVRVI